MSKLISNYMGWNPIFTPDWNMLMEVIDKIGNSDNIYTSVGFKACNITVYDPLNLGEMLFDKKIIRKSTLQASVDCVEEFIKWKNS